MLKYNEFAANVNLLVFRTVFEVESFWGNFTIQISPSKTQKLEN